MTDRDEKQTNQDGESERDNIVITRECGYMTRLDRIVVPELSVESSGKEFTGAAALTRLADAINDDSTRVEHINGNRVEDSDEPR